MRTPSNKIGIYCDFCGKEAYRQCVNDCGNDVCFQCAINMSYAVHFTGSKDGIFCPLCFKQLLANPTPIFAAYQRIKKLAEEEQEWMKDFNQRVIQAESELEKSLSNRY